MAHLAIKAYADVAKAGLVSISVAFVLLSLALSVLFAALAVAVLVRRLRFPRVLELTDDAVLFPYGFHRRPRAVTIPYIDILRIEDFGDSIEIATIGRAFKIEAIRCDGYRAVRENVSAKTANRLPDYDGRQPLRRCSGGLPRPLVHWVEQEEWFRYRVRAELSKPILGQLRRESSFFLRCCAFSCVFLFLPCLALNLLSSFYFVGETRFFRTTIGTLGAAALWTAFVTMLHWLEMIYRVRPEAEISFRDRAITQRLPSGQVFDWSFRQFRGWAVIEREFHGHILRILILRHVTNGLADNVAFALPDATVRDQVAQILTDKQVPQEPDLKPSWEAI